MKYNDSHKQYWFILWTKSGWQSSLSSIFYWDLLSWCVTRWLPETACRC